VAGRYADDLVIGADTIVVLGTDILGKPTNRVEAIAMLMHLGGNIHQVYTGVALVCEARGIHRVFHERTDVEFKPLHREEIEFYLDHFAPYDKAGSYGIQDWSAVFVSSLKGCYYNVMGFPLFRLSEHLEQLEMPLRSFHNSLGV